MLNEIVQLQKAANGFIVILPFRNEYLPAPDFTNEEVIRRQVRILRDEYEKDPLLSNLMADMEKEPIVSQPYKPENNIYIFKTFNEVTDFLKNEFYK